MKNLPCYKIYQSSEGCKNPETGVLVKMSNDLLPFCVIKIMMIYCNESTSLIQEL